MDWPEDCLTDLSIHPTVIRFLILGTGCVLFAGGQWLALFGVCRLP